MKSWVVFSNPRQIRTLKQTQYQGSIDAPLPDPETFNIGDWFQWGNNPDAPVILVCYEIA